MGNIVGNVTEDIRPFVSDGIMEQGGSVEKFCTTCKNLFHTRRGRVTIKGPVREATECETCRTREIRGLLFLHRQQQINNNKYKS